MRMYACHTHARTMNAHTHAHARTSTHQLPAAGLWVNLLVQCAGNAEWVAFDACLNFRAGDGYLHVDQLAIVGGSAPRWEASVRERNGPDPVVDMVADCA